MRVWTKLVLFALALLSLPVQADEAGDGYAIRSQGYILASSLLAYFDPYEKYSDPKYRVAYRQALERLDELTADSELRLSVRRIKELVDGLEKQSLHEIQGSYPQWINPVLEQHAEMDRLAIRLQAQTEPRSETVMQIQRLSLLNSQMLLLYQTKAAQLMALHVNFSENSALELDAEIVELFGRVQSKNAQWQEPLRKLAREYEFVRPQLVDGRRRVTTGSVGFYLGGIVSGLNALLE
ncbi:hypothetical protein [Metapseudomonas boanensis]|uniref:Uncharacterized protein n=1 Tax=Metapseudomonas boanensis TaxID=2822138 RepID=A0ABS5XG81_9GAMM|nr:hypothetical protein [Pseudomonas boanensis]MBT8766709.1 hypothetical protein [Pseudomonas boanensis]